MTMHPALRAGLFCLALTPLTACDLQVGGPPLISGQSPASVLSRNSEPEPAGSLPPRAMGLAGGPNSMTPNYASVTFPTPF